MLVKEEKKKWSKVVSQRKIHTECTKWELRNSYGHVCFKL